MSDTQQLSGNNYQIIRKRLSSAVNDLLGSLDKLNDKRKNVFGAYEMTLEGTERVTTVNNSIAWDLFALDQNHFLFGYNVQLGLKTEIKIEDVFNCYEYKEGIFVKKPCSFFENKEFEKEFNNLYKFYKKSKFVKFHRIGSYLYMVFRVGKHVDDVKCFKWLIKEGSLEFIDARSDHEYVFPAQHEFIWKKTTRDQHYNGKHPHISLDDIVYVETVGGDLTVKVENNTKSGQGIYAEPVDQIDQTLDDAEVLYANLGNLVIFKIKPYQEKKFRHFVFNVKMQEVRRIDAIENSCVLLPEDQGIIFSNGYYLQSGEYKLFDNEYENMSFIGKKPSSNGEDFLYSFYEKETGSYLLVIYNIIEQEIQTPIFCHGYASFDNGSLFLFKGDEEAKKHHAFQIWNTPFISEDIQHKHSQSSDSLLAKIGNKEVVRAMAETKEIISLSDKEDSYEGLYIDIYKKCNDVLDTYHWLSNEESEGLYVLLEGVRNVSKSAIDEFEKIVRQKKSAEEAILNHKIKIQEVKKEFTRASSKTLQTYIATLGKVRGLKGGLISVLEIPLIDKKKVSNLKIEVDEYADNLSNKTIDFLAQDNALIDYSDRIIEHQKQFKEITKVIDCNDLEAEVSETSVQLETLIDIVSNLQIEDSTKTTAILDEISALYTKLNTQLADIRKKRKDYRATEGKAEFKSQLNLLSQSLLNFIDLSDTIGKCDEYLAKLLVQLEELEGKFSDFEDFLEEIESKREDIYTAFETKKSQLKESLNKRIQNLNASGERVLSASSNRLKKFTSENDINAFIASDVMVEKLRRSINELKKLGDGVKAEALESKLLALHGESIRNLRDKKELFAEGTELIKFGEHQFLVNKQELLPSLILQDDRWMLHLTGSNFYEEIDLPEIYEYKSVWSQSIMSENKSIYRAEYLAFDIYKKSSANELKKLNELTEEDLILVVSGEVSNRLDEGYTRGVHDIDGAILLKEILRIHFTTGDLKFSPTARVIARWYWENIIDDKLKIEYTKRLKGAGLLLSAFADTNEFDGIKEDLFRGIASMDILVGGNDGSIIEASDYLFEALANQRPFIISITAVELVNSFFSFLNKKSIEEAFFSLINDVEIDQSTRYKMTMSWLNEFLTSTNSKKSEFINESAYLIVQQVQLTDNIARFDTSAKISKLKGDHKKVDANYELNFHELQSTYSSFINHTQPDYNKFRELKKTLVKDFKKEYRLDSFKPQVMNSFVRNRLINNVYLPLIGANLTKQIGGAGENKRTDLMGLLLLISPPGYGKTTLMEYVASRIGVTFMKINGPSIGHSVTSLDPASAPEATSKEELEKLNFAFELGDNVMIYLDDIQHCNPEFLQKFISLCDAQRKIEGVYKGESKTYDFRGKKVSVVMAGNPYTESGDKFRIPDMLANRADIYNLGDVIGDSDQDFKLSYIENTLSSNKALSILKNKSKEDVYKLIRAAERGEAMVGGLSSNLQSDQINDVLQVLKHLLIVRDVILKVNGAYIFSAGVGDEFRVEPAFKLQGSYRNINKITEKLAPLMSEKEVWTIIYSHYENECQTLTNGAEANFLKFLEIINRQSELEKQRWREIKEVFCKNTQLKSAGGDQFGAAIVQLQNLNESIKSIGNSVDKPSSSRLSDNTDGLEAKETLKLLSQKLDAYLKSQLSLQRDLVDKKATLPANNSVIDKESIIKEILDEIQNQEKKTRLEQKDLITGVRLAEEKRLESLRKEFPLTVVGKDMIKDGGQEYISFDFSINNESSTAVKLIIGELEFQDNFGDKISLMNITYDERIEVNESKVWKAQVYYNRYLDQDILLNKLELTDLKVIWRVKKIV
jgi:hypothetical protein